MVKINMIFRGSMSITSKTQGKKLQREISLAQQIEPERRMRWSDECITFGPESKGHLFIFIFIKFIQHAKEEDYKALGLSLSSDSTRLVKSYEDMKS
jgi:hypothetical protein